MLDASSDQDLCLFVSLWSNSQRRMPVIDGIQLTWMTFFGPAIDTNTHTQCSLCMESFFYVKYFYLIPCVFWIRQLNIRELVFTEVSSILIAWLGTSSAGHRRNQAAD